MLVDRARFPRHKLCGDTLNPGAVDLLDSLALGESPLATALPIAGMLVTGPHAAVEARYGNSTVGRAIERSVLDSWLLSRAVAAGVTFEDGVIVRDALVDSTPAGNVVHGARVTAGASPANLQIAARMTLAADGRASVMARALGLSSYALSPRRWAYGTYASGVIGTSSLGEMHIRGRKYIGVAPVSSELCNVCVVTGLRQGGRKPLEIVRSEIDADPVLRERFAGARFEAPVSVLGPLAVTSHACGASGLLLAGDAAGFVDPMTGDGLHLALRGGLLAADEILASLERGESSGAAARLATARTSALGPKLRFNRALRRLVETPAAVSAAALIARVSPSAVRWAVRYAGDAA